MFNLAIVGLSICVTEYSNLFLNWWIEVQTLSMSRELILVFMSLIGNYSAWREKFWQSTYDAWREKFMMTHVFCISRTSREVWGSSYLVLVLTVQFYCIMVIKHSTS
jgi:hypothetical protein